MSLEQGLNRAWYGKPKYLLLLAPLEYLYRAIVALRRRLIRPQSCGAPLIVIGNISVGGSGKTPVVLAVADYCTQLGYKVGIVSRGYGGSAPQYPYVLTGASSPAESGDEPFLMYQRSGLPVAVAPDRLAAARMLVEQHDCNLIISDDGLQHYRLARDIEVLVVDGERGFGNGHCLPVGPLREPISRASEVNLKIINGGNALLHGYSMDLRGVVAVNLLSAEPRAIADWPANEKRIHAIAGIGNPQRFFRSLQGMGFELIEHPFPDHHDFTVDDLLFDDSLPVIMTEKDAVKCRAFGMETHWMLPVSGEIDPLFYRALQTNLANVRHIH